MQKSPTRRTAKRATSVQPALSSQTADEREPRGARRKRETRSRLLEAARKLMVQKGTASVAINEITEAADVGSGSFYNHFESKEAIYTALTDEVFEEFGNALDRLADGLSDPAEVISYCMRHTLLRAHREPHWGRFLAREGLCALAPSCGLGQRLLRDVQRGIASNRFSVADPLMAIISLGGTALAAIATDLKMAQSADPQAPAVRHLGFSSSYFAERAATVALQTLGIRRAEANRIAKQPLPAVDW